MVRRSSGLCFKGDHSRRLVSLRSKRMEVRAEVLRLLETMPRKDEDKEAGVDAKCSQDSRSIGRIIMYPCSECIHDNPNRGVNNLRQIKCHHPDAELSDKWPTFHGVRGKDACNHFEPSLKARSKSSMQSKIGNLDFMLETSLSM